MSADLRPIASGTRRLLSELIHSAVVNPAGDRLGRVQDVIVRLGGSGYPKVSGLKVRLGGRDVFVPEQMLARLEPGRVQLHGQTLDVRRFERRPGAHSLDGSRRNRMRIRRSLLRRAGEHDPCRG